MADWYRVASDGRITLTLHIQPGAKTSEVCGQHGEALKIRLAAPPVDGKANAALLAFLANQLGLSRQAVSLISGDSNRRKRVEISGSTTAAVERLLPP
ncbi:MAG: DUF167 family protein [Dechloromonas sp.]|nr:DUF167 family protein [Dechloromonas sp.]